MGVFLFPEIDRSVVISYISPTDMPHTTITHLPKSEVKIEFEVSVDLAQPYLKEAVREMSEARPIPGFRPGKAPYEEIKKAFGEMRIYEAALERIVRAEYARAIVGEKLAPIASPTVNVDALTPGQPIKFHIIVPVEPTMTTAPDLSACTVKKAAVDVKETDVDEAVEELRKMRREEVKVERAATLEDLVLIDLEMTRDGVALEGGTGRDYRVYLKEQHYIPGFAKELEGISAGETRTFTLQFPEEHFQKHLSGQPVDFKATATGVFELRMPTADDAFAKGVGLETLTALREKLKENMTLERSHKANEAAEIEMLEKLTDAAAFTEIPEVLVNEEVRRMMNELQQGVEEQGMKWEDYLSNLKKTADALKLDFVPQALRRIKTAVLIKSFAKQQNIQVEQKELDEEQDRILSGIKPTDHETRAQVSSPEFRDYIAVQIRNRKTLQWIKEQCVKE